MPIYCFTNARTGVTIEREFRPNSVPKRIVEDRLVYTRDYHAENVGVPSSAGWPLECVASGVAPDQAGELSEFLKSRGVPTEVTKDGNPVYRNAAHRRKALKARGIHDNSSFV